MFGRTFSEYIRFQKPVLTATFVVGLASLGLAASGRPDVARLLLGLVSVAGFIYCGVASYTHGFDNYKQLLPPVFLQNALLVPVGILVLVADSTRGSVVGVPASGPLVGALFAGVLLGGFALGLGVPVGWGVAAAARLITKLVLLLAERVSPAHGIKFCPRCDARRPAPEAHCSSCGYAFMPHRRSLSLPWPVWIHMAFTIILLAGVPLDPDFPREIKMYVYPVYAPLACFLYWKLLHHRHWSRIVLALMTLPWGIALMHRACAPYFDPVYGDPAARGEPGPQQPTRPAARHPVLWLLLGVGLALAAASCVVTVAFAVFMSRSKPEERRAETDPVTLQRGCDAGRYSECYRLGVLYDEGKSVAKDPGMAAALYKRACDGGVPVACNDLGVMYGSDQGVYKDLSRETALYKQACDGGSATGCYNLGLMYKKGEGVRRDVAKAAALFEEACRGGDTDGCRAHKQLSGP